MSVMPAHNRALCLYDGYDCRIPLQLPLLTLSLKYSFQSEALLVSCISTAWGPLSSTSHYLVSKSWMTWNSRRIQSWCLKLNCSSENVTPSYKDSENGTSECYSSYLLPEPDSPLGTPSVYPFHLAGIVIPTF